MTSPTISLRKAPRLTSVLAPQSGSHSAHHPHRDDLRAKADDSHPPLGG